MRSLSLPRLQELEIPLHERLAAMGVPPLMRGVVHEYMRLQYVTQHGAGVFERIFGLWSERVRLALAAVVLIGFFVAASFAATSPAPTQLLAFGLLFLGVVLALAIGYIGPRERWIVRGLTSNGKYFDEHLRVQEVPAFVRKLMDKVRIADPEAEFRIRVFGADPILSAIDDKGKEVFLKVWDEWGPIDL